MDSLCMLVHVVEEAQTLAAADKVPQEPEAATSSSNSVRVMNEATYRHQWDQLIMTIVNRCGSNDVRYE